MQTNALENMMRAARVEPVCAKEDLIRVAHARRLPCTANELWALNAVEFAKLQLQPATVDECAVVRSAQAQRRVFEQACTPHMSLSTLANHVRAAGGVCPRGVTRGGAIDILIALGGIPLAVKLDEDQAAAVARWRAPRTLIYAGPGAGKTTTVCHMIQTAVQAGARVLVLAYNVVAQETLDERLARMHVPRIYKTRVGDNAADVGSGSASDGGGSEARAELKAGAAVLTFDKLAAQVMGVGSLPLPSEFTDSYRRALENAAIRIANNRGFGAWDMVVVDEAQDIVATHVAIIDGLLMGTAPMSGSGGEGIGSSPRLVAAGDPRQELYGGARWFSDAWATAPAEDRVVLRYNHRSAPRIVGALNAFSRTNFPTLHCDQISVRPDGDAAALRFTIIPCGVSKSQDMLAIGDAVGRAVSQGTPGDCYAVAPVTTGKFGFDCASTLARQVVATEKPGALVYEARAEEKLARGTYAIATSQKIKGTERARVVVYGTDEDYSICVDHAQFVRRVFVAMSRARDELVIVFRNRAPPTAHAIMQSVLDFAGVAGHVVTQQLVFPSPRRIPVVPVAGTGAGIGALNGVCACRGVGGIVVCSSTIEPSVSLASVLCEAQGDADFMGVYAETLVLRALGMETVGNCIVVGDANAANHSVTYLPETPFQKPCFRAIVRPIDVARMQAMCDDISDKKNSGSDPAYLHAVLRYSLTIHQEWTLSDRFQHLSCDNVRVKVAAAADAISAAVEQVRRMPGFACVATRPRIPSFQPSCEHPVGCRRAAPSADLACNIRFVPDAVLRGVPLELKHVSDLSDDHRRQVAIYAALLGASHALLVNTSNGTLEVVCAVKAGDVAAIARATAALREARACGRGPDLMRRAIRAPAAAVGSCLVAVDAETDGFGAAFEIGAVAFDADTGSVIATFDALADGATEIAGAVPQARGTPFTSTAALTGVELVPLDPRRADASRALVDRFHEWIARLPARRSFLHWGGSERALLRQESDAAIDVHRSVFLPWLESGGFARRDHTTLVDAVAQVVPHIAFASHRAFDDALLTLCVYVVAVSTGSQL